MGGALATLFMLCPGVSTLAQAPAVPPAEVPATAPDDSAGPARPMRPEVWDLKVGQPIAAQPVDFQEFACGTNGGPPGRRLTGFAEFAQCKLDAETGLYEVQFRYDDELEYWARAIGVTAYAEKYGGTDILSYPVIISALIDADGVLRGWRAASDDRVELRIRRSAFQLANALKSRFGSDLWACRDLPALDGETPFASRLIKQNCKATLTDDTVAYLETRLVRRKGQRMVDPHSGQVFGDRFISTARILVVDPGVTIPETIGDDR